MDARRARRTPLIDCDVHPLLPDFRTLLPYLAEPQPRRIEPAMHPRAGSRVRVATYPVEVETLDVEIEEAEVVVYV